MSIVNSAIHQPSDLVKLRFRITLGEVEPSVEFGPATSELFDPNLQIGQISEREFWVDFRARVESKQGPML